MIATDNNGRELANVYVEGQGLEITKHGTLILDGGAVHCNQCDFMLNEKDFMELDMPQPDENDLRDPDFDILCAFCLKESK